MFDLNKCTLEEVYAQLNALSIPFRLEGPDRKISKVCSLLHKEPNGLYYFSGSKPHIIEGLKDSIIVCNDQVLEPSEDYSTLVVKGDPQVVFYKLCARLFGGRNRSEIHPTAIIHPEAEIGSEVYVGPYSVVGRSRVGSGSRIEAHCVIFDGCDIGERVRIDPHSCIGAAGAVWVWGDGNQRVILPQVGGVRIEDDVFLASDVTVVRGLFNEWTTIGKGTLIAPGSKIGHSVMIGSNCHLANNVSIAGSAIIGDGTFLGSGSSVRSHARLAADTIVGSGAAVVKDVLRTGVTVAGVPAVEMEPKSQRKGVPTAKPEN